MKVLLKLGGTLLDDPAKLTSMAGQLARVAAEHQLVVVHGGGKQVTRFLEAQGVTSQFVHGLRVSDDQVIDAVTKVIAGSVNKRLTAALMATGCMAIGLSGVDGGIARAEQLDPALQFVGRPVAANGQLLQLLIDAGYLPVIACIAGDEHGHIYNVNADSMAVAVATGWKAERLVFLTDVAGVKDENGSVLPTLSADAVSHLISSGVAHGGMQAKLESALLAVNNGLRVTIALGSEPDIAQRLLAGESLGTDLQPASAASGQRS